MDFTLDELEASVAKLPNSEARQALHNIIVRMREIDSPIGQSRDDAEAYNLLWDALLDEIGSAAGLR